MITSESLISNISYTNKDFNAIYPALLDLVKKITYRWDPSISNESDPGVILLKLNALIADKCNYNIDKNVLECFPMSVTQDRNARQLYAQLGYFMHWRLAAETVVTMRWVGETGTDTYTIPKFSMVADSNNNIVYTLTDENMSLPLDGSYAQFAAMQGIATNYVINGSTNITAENLDSNNRLYFDYNDVAENGIFIKNANSTNYGEWTKVDNLLVEEISSNSKYYSFGVTQDTNVCYIEFPENAQEIFEGGIEITYLKTDGEFGNIAPFVIDKFYDNVLAEGTNTILNSENVQIINYVPGIGGENPETIDSAFKNYKKTIGTFNTLVTLRDYTNAIIRYQNVSNAVVCDRTNDIQSCYDILSVVNDVNQPITVTEMSGGEPIISPFDIKLYMLFDYSEAITDTMTADRYNKTFKLLDEVDIVEGTHLVDDAEAYINDLSHISHNYLTVTSDDGEGNYLFADKMCFLKNYYPIFGTIIPQYKLPIEQKNEVRENVKTALFDALNAQQVEFGEEIDYDLVYNTILNADTRIKSVRLNDITYETYAVYMWATGVPENPIKFKEVRIDEQDTRVNDDDGFNYQEVSESLRLEIAAKAVLAGVTPLCVADENMSPQVGQNWQVVGSDYLYDTKYITTNLDKQFEHTSNTYTYTVADNESISLYAPNLVDIDEYTSYVRYEYYLNDGGTPQSPETKVISPNTSYTLEENEYIAFYWAADVDSGYNYTVYGEGQIIRATFELNSEQDDTLPLALKSELVISPDKKISGVSYEVSGLDIHIADLPSSNVLSSTKTVVIQIMNRVELDSNGYYCSWILNTTDEYDEYVLFKENQPYYQLKTGEYFLYTDSTRTSLVILGAGTLLDRSDYCYYDEGTSQWVGGWTEEWACSAYKYSSIISDGMDALVNTANALQKIKQDAKLTVIEQQFITLNSGATLKLIGTPATDPEIKTLDDNDNKYEYNITPAEFTEISYKGKDDAGYTNIPMVGVNNNAWTLMCQLNINMSKEYPQILTDGQSITLKDDISDAGVDIEPQGTPLHVSSSISITLGGGEDINVTTISDTEELQIPKISVFTVADSDTYVSYTESGQTSIRLIDNDSVTHTTQTLDMTLPPGKYIMVLQHNNNNLSDLYVKYLDDSKLNKFGNALETSFSDPGTYYLEINSPSSPVESLTVGGAFSPDATIKDDIIIIKECLLYTEYNDVPGINSSDLVTEVVNLNSAYLFDFSYQVDPDEVIKNPLSSTSFFEPTHPFNKCVIGQLDTSSLKDLYISEKTRG